MNSPAPDHQPKARRQSADRKLVDFPGAKDMPDLPHSLEAEEYLLSCCFIDGSVTVAMCLTYRLTSQSFFAPANQVIFSKLVDLHTRNLPIDTAIVAEELKASGQLDAVGGFAYIAQVSSRIPTTAQAVYFVERVRDLVASRAAVLHGRKLAEDAGNLSGGGRELADKLELHASWTARALEQLRAGAVTMDERLARAMERSLAKVAGTADTSRQLFTGMPEFDATFGPFDVCEEEWLIGLAAATSRGKSALSRTFADAFLKRGKTGLVFLLETSAGKWLELAAATAAGVNARELKGLPRDLAEKFERELRERHGWKGKNLFICEESLKAEVLCARIDEHVRRHGRPDFVVVDHLHELSSTENFRGQRMVELSHISRLLKRTAFRLDVPFFVPMQLNRAPQKDGSERRPTKHDVRDCGEVENACDKMLLIHLPSKDAWGNDQDENTARVMIELICDKNRNGALGRREFWFERKLTRFSGISPRELDLRAKLPPPKAEPGKKPSRKAYF